MMLLKQSSSRNLRSKSIKVKHALWIFILLAICIWFLYQVKQSYNKKDALEEKPTKILQNGESEYQILKMGRKDLKPRLDEVADEKNEDEEVELEDDEGKVKENEGDENVDPDEEIDEADKDKSEEGESDQLQDLIDEDDKDG